MKTEILELRAKGLTYNQIRKALSCSLSIINYYCAKDGKAKANKRSIKNRSGRIEEVKKARGGACELCGWDKCMRGLVFHHRDPKTKKFGISDRKNRSLAEIKAEADKCALLCANCHALEHHMLRNGMTLFTQST